MALDVGTLVARLQLDRRDFEQGVEQSERRFSKLGSALGAAAKGIGLAAGAGLTAAGAVGISTAARMEQAEIAFSTMLGSGEKAKVFLGDLSAFAAKTPFEFPELQTAASSLVSAGVEANKVIPIMTTLGDVTSGMGTGSEGVKRATVALQQMNAAGRITGEDLNQLRDAGIPVYDLLASATGKSKEEIVKLAQAGKLGKTELDAMMKALENGQGLEKFTGLMAAQSTSLTGLWSTLKDTFSTGMATAIQPLIPLIKDGLGGAIGFLTANMPRLATGLAGVVTSVREFFAARQAGGGGDLGELFDRVANAARAAWPQIQAAAGQAAGLGPILTLAGAGAGFLVGHLDTVVKYMPLLVAAFVAYKLAQTASMAVDIARLPLLVAQIASNCALAGANTALAAAMGVERTSRIASIATGAVHLGQVIASTVATGAHTAAMWIANGAAKAWAAGQWLLNAALTANPIGLVIAAIALLVGGLVIAYKNSETFRNVVTGAWNGIQAAVGAAWGFIRDQVFAPLGTFLTGTIPAWFTTFRVVVSGVWGAFRDVLAGGWNFVRDNIFAPLGHFVGTIMPGIFSAGVDAVGRTWDLLKEKLRAPIRIAFDFVNGNVINPLNGILGKFPGGLSVPRLPALATGGLLRGPGTGTSDSILGVDERGVPTARVSNGEYVIRKAAVDKYGPGLLDAINVGSYAGGGIVDGLKSLGGALLPDFVGQMAARGARFAAEAVIGPLRAAAHRFLPADQIPLNLLRGGVDQLFDAVLRKGDDQDKAQVAAAAAAGGAPGGGVAGRGNVDAELLRRFDAWNASIGGGLRIVSGYRSSARQAQLYAAYLNGTGNLAAPPGSSNHEKSPARAIDYGPANWARTATSYRFGLKAPVRSEPWHLERAFDAGGVAYGSGMMPKFTSAPERVLSPRQTESFERLVDVLDRQGEGDAGPIELGPRTVSALVAGFHGGVDAAKARLKDDLVYGRNF